MTSYLLQQFLNGAQLGTIYALIALGYTMVYGIIKLINFAHADIFMVGAYLAFFLLSFHAGASEMQSAGVWVWISIIGGYLVWSTAAERMAGLRRILAAMHGRCSHVQSWTGRAAWTLARFAASMGGIAAASAALFPCVYYPTKAVFGAASGAVLFALVTAYVMVVCGLMGVAMERVAYRPLRNEPRLSALITALGVSLFLENFCSLDIAFTNQYRPFPPLVGAATLVRLESLDISISSAFVLNIAVLAVLLAGLWFLVEKTLIGKQMRAVSFDKKAAALMGIDVNRVIATTFFIGPALAGVSGILFAMNYGILQSPFLGFFPGIKAFIAAVLGGIGSLPGAVLGAMLLGIIEVMANSVDSNLGFAAAFVVLIVILLLRPAGIMGKKEVEKV